MNVKDLLKEKIEKQIKSLDGMKVGSDEYETTVNSITKMLDKLNEMDRNEHDYLEKRESREKENDLKLKQMKEERLDHIAKNLLTGISVIGGFALTIWGTYKSFEFEKTGSITTIMGRGFINKLIPKK